MNDLGGSLRCLGVLLEWVRGFWGHLRDFWGLLEGLWWQFESVGGLLEWV